ncbi:hypothetical protein [Ekhidna sp.]|uniref:hypothetical protein n=1 Tax=Ekhidna sp. TaxID=2608089 RepID=UPI003CCBCD15
MARAHGYDFNRWDELQFNLTQIEYLQELGFFKREVLLRTKNYDRTVKSLNLSANFQEKFEEVIRWDEHGIVYLDKLPNVMTESPVSWNQEFCDVCTRVCSQLLNNENQTVTPILGSIPSKSSYFDGRQSEVLNIILKQFPEPDSSVSWEQLIDFKKDDDSQIKLQRLRNWVSKISKTELNISEIEDELEYLIKEYEYQMKLHKMKYSYKNLEVVITGIAEFIEHLATIKFGKLAKSFFEFRNRKIDLLITESNIPGKEIGYLSKVNDQIAKKTNS